MVAFAAGSGVLAALLLIGRRVTGAARVVRTGRAEGKSLRLWWFGGGIGGAALVGSNAYAVPLVGVAFATVCLVAGQLVGSVGVDLAGIGPGGRRHLTGWRLAGVLIALAGLALAAVGRSGGAGGARVGLLLVVAGAGLLVAYQQAANGHVQAATGEPLVASLVSFTGGGLLAGAASIGLLTSGAAGPVTIPSVGHGWLFFGGIGGASYLAITAATVRKLGVLHLSLATTAGQLLAGLIFDVALPTGESLRWTTVVGAGLAFVAVVVAGRGTGSG
jgi:transporter family-2 protein